jgi:hypothetical protein
LSASRLMCLNPRGRTPLPVTNWIGDWTPQGRSRSCWEEKNRRDGQTVAKFDLQFSSYESIKITFDYLPRKSEKLQKVASNIKCSFHFSQQSLFKIFLSQKNI